jgi:c-di-GMP-binding flagellar brake protein YcgR
MFERTFSFWRRLVNKVHPSQVPASQERRLWVRYPAELQTNVQLAAEAETAQPTRFSVSVRDISLGGANLLADRAFETGQMLGIELPQAGKDESHTVLACIVRVVPEGPGQWALGCVFSRELTDEDLEGFGAKRVRHPPSDQRTWMRFVTKLKANFQKVGDPENRTYSGQVLNLSASGVGLDVKVAVDAGTLLSVDLIGTEGKVIRTILACVVHVTTKSAQEWSLGCNFIRQLSEEDLKALI